MFTGHENDAYAIAYRELEDATLAEAVARKVIEYLDGMDFERKSLDVPATVEAAVRRFVLPPRKRRELGVFSPVLKETDGGEVIDPEEVEDLSKPAKKGIPKADSKTAEEDKPQARKKKDPPDTVPPGAVRVAKLPEGILVEDDEDEDENEYESKDEDEGEDEDRAKKLRALREKRSRALRVRPSKGKPAAGPKVKKGALPEGVKLVDPKAFERERAVVKKIAAQKAAKESLARRAVKEKARKSAAEALVRKKTGKASPTGKSPKTPAKGPGKKPKS